MFPPTWLEGFLLSTPSAEFIVVDFFEIPILIIMKCYLIGPLICLSLRTNDADNLFFYFMAISMPSLEKCAFRCLEIFIGLLGFLY